MDFTTAVIVGAWLIQVIPSTNFWKAIQSTGPNRKALALCFWPMPSPCIMSHRALPRWISLQENCDAGKLCTIAELGSSTPLDPMNITRHLPGPNPIWIITRERSCCELCCCFRCAIGRLLYQFIVKFPAKIICGSLRESLETCHDEVWSMAKKLKIGCCQSFKTTGFCQPFPIIH